jgi:DNA processing protein
MAHDKIYTMNFPIHNVPAGSFPALLRHIPDPPQKMNYRGVLPPPDMKLLTIVGSRNYTSYGKQCVDELVAGLRGYNVGIVSGLALGIDSIAHEAALKNDMYTLVIPGGGIDDSVIYPASHKNLAKRILEAGGCLISEFEPTFKAQMWSFPKRNRIQAGISHATLLIEAAEKSGTLITARLCVDFNRELLVVPGSIFSKQHAGVHQFLKLGATPVTCAKDILTELHIDTSTEPKTIPLPNLSAEEVAVLKALHEPMNRDELMRTLDMPIEKATQLLMMMELGGLVVLDAGMYRAGR